MELKKKNPNASANMMANQRGSINTHQHNIPPLEKDVANTRILGPPTSSVAPRTLTLSDDDLTKPAAVESPAI